MPLVWKDQGADLVTRVGPFTLSVGRSLETVGRDPAKPFDGYIWRHGIILAYTIENASIEDAQKNVVVRLRKHFNEERAKFGELEQELAQ